MNTFTEPWRLITNFKLTFKIQCAYQTVFSFEISEKWFHLFFAQMFTQESFFKSSIMADTKLNLIIFELSCVHYFSTFCIAQQIKYLMSYKFLVQYPNHLYFRHIACKSNIPWIKLTPVGPSCLGNLQTFTQLTAYLCY